MSVMLNQRPGIPAPAPTLPDGSPAAVIVAHRKQQAETKLWPEYRKLVARLATGEKLTAKEAAATSELLRELELTPERLNADCNIFAEVQGLAPTAKHCEENQARMEKEVVAAGEAVKKALAAVPLARGKHSQLADQLHQLRIAKIRWRMLQEQNPRLFDALPPR